MAALGFFIVAVTSDESELVLFTKIVERILLQANPDLNFIPALVAADWTNNVDADVLVSFYSTSLRPFGLELIARRERTEIWLDRRLDLNAMVRLNHKQETGLDIVLEIRFQDLTKYLPDGYMAHPVNFG